MKDWPKNHLKCNERFCHYKFTLTDPLRPIFTARKRSLRRLCFYRCVSVHRALLSQHALQVVSQHALQQVSGGVGRGVGGGWMWGALETCKACWDTTPTHTQGGSLEGSGWRGGGSTGPYPRGKLRGSSPGPQPRGKLRGIWPGGGAYCCEWYASYWNAFLFFYYFVQFF